MKIKHNFRLEPIISNIFFNPRLYWHLYQALVAFHVTVLSITLLQSMRITRVRNSFLF